MDVEVTLTQMRSLIEDIHAADESDAKRDKAWCEAQATRASELADAAAALDEWLTKGGFPPAAWTRPGVTPPTRRTCNVCGAVVPVLRGIGPVYGCLHGTHPANGHRKATT